MKQGGYSMSDCENTRPQSVWLDSFLSACKNNVDRVNCKEANMKAHSVHEPLRHGIMNMIDEAGELATILKDRMYYGKEISALHMIEELGDFFWGYVLLVEVLANLLDIPFQEMFVLIFKVNSAKLHARYEHEYTDKEAVNRDIPNEYTKMAIALGKHRSKIEGVNL